MQVARITATDDVDEGVRPDGGIFAATFREDSPGRLLSEPGRLSKNNGREDEAMRRIENIYIPLS